MVTTEIGVGLCWTENMAAPRITTKAMPTRATRMLESQRKRRNGFAEKSLIVPPIVVGLFCLMGSSLPQPDTGTFLVEASAATTPPN